MKKLRRTCGFKNKSMTSLEVCGLNYTSTAGGIGSILVRELGPCKLYGRDEKRNKKDGYKIRRTG